MIKSVENAKIKEIVKLRRKKFRDLTGTYFVEGYHLIEEAFKSGVVQEIYLLEGVDCPFDAPKEYVTPEIMKKISTLDTPCDMIAVCRKIQYQDIQDSHRLIHKVILLDEIQDPGNLGTIIRSSVAFGIDMIILSENTVDLYNPKVLRATQGMYCHIPILSLRVKEAIQYFRQNHYAIYGTNVVNGVDARSLGEDDKKKFCLIMGNEGNGIRPEIQALCDKNLYIPMRKEAESLNVGVACSILLYELGR